jgi:hypothetical protein
MTRRKIAIFFAEKRRSPAENSRVGPPSTKWREIQAVQVVFKGRNTLLSRHVSSRDVIVVRLSWTKLPTISWENFELYLSGSPCPHVTWRDVIVVCFYLNSTSGLQSTGSYSRVCWSLRMPGGCSWTLKALSIGLANARFSCFSQKSFAGHPKILRA